MHEDILKLIDQDEVLKIVQDMVRIPSINPHGTERDVANYIIRYFESNGIETTIQEVFPDRYNVVSRLKGQGIASSILFTGHMDVVPVSIEESKKWRTGPFASEIQNGFLYGRGSADMKGGLGAAMVAMATLAKHKVQPPGDIILAATVDEEDLMRGAKALIKTSLVSDATKMVVCEPTNMDIVTACRGRTWAEIVVEGQTAHASIQGAGVNAIDRAVILMNRMKTYQIPYEKHGLLGDSFWQVTMINGGIEPAIIPDSCTITIDGRLVPGQMPEDMWNEMKKMINLIKEKVPNFNVKVNIIEAREPWEISNKDDFVKIVAKACKEINLPVKYSGFSGTTDGTIFRRIGIEGIILGPGELKDNVHKENERVSIRQLVQATQIYALIMLSWNK
ncbi:MAG: M20 family metallopeptidase [Dehalobacterium sp.]